MSLTGKDLALVVDMLDRLLSWTRRRRLQPLMARVLVPEYAGAGYADEWRRARLAVDCLTDEQVRRDVDAYDEQQEAAQRSRRARRERN